MLEEGSRPLLMKWKFEWEACPDQQWKEKNHMQRAPCMGKPELQPVPDAGAAEAQMSSGNLHSEPQRVLTRWECQSTPAPGSATHQPARTSRQHLVPGTTCRRTVQASDWWVPPGRGFSSHDIPQARSQIFFGHLFASPMPAVWKGPCFSLFPPPV